MSLPSFHEDVESGVEHEFLTSYDSCPYFRFMRMYIEGGVEDEDEDVEHIPTLVS